MCIRDSIFGAYIMFVGYKIIRKALRGIMDEADLDMLSRLAKFLNENRKPEWIDIHNMRCLLYTSRCV